ncbi:MAG: Gfo/Idh/MocA family oxidoreductase [Chitinophagaceae bacterium]
MEQMINWGIIGCGDVTEVKSGPAFNKVPGSRLIAVMRRNAGLAADYAQRHGVPRWYADATALINDPEVNAIYIATPPSSHETYALQAIAAGKPVYLEKPMTPDAPAAQRVAAAAIQAGVKLTVAHYRREQPFYKKLKELIAGEAIGKIQLVYIACSRHLLSTAQLAQSRTAWRVDPAIAGGGLFHDLAPHQLDILYYLFGAASAVQGMALQQSGTYAAPDLVSGTIVWPQRILFTGIWNFNQPASKMQEDECVITGTDGEIRFSFFEQAPLRLIKNGQMTAYEFPPLPHVQEPMIRQVVEYFQGKTDNPCTALEGVQVMEWIDQIAVLR